MKSILVIGMGRFGRHLARKMQELKNDVMIVDRDADIIRELAYEFTDAQIGDCTSEAVLRSLGVSNFDICFVSIGENFQSSLEITSLLKELGAKKVVSKANKEIQAKFLLKNGADEVVYPEKEMAQKVAIKYNANNIFDYIELTSDFAIFEIPVPAGWLGKSLIDVDVRKKHRINILAIKNNEVLTQMPPAEYEFREGDHMVVIGKSSDVYKLTSKM
ncbi:MAG: TrkA family potassium uptake protein [Clostridiales bacterium]|nr:TrkA family potassium uptake protein [Clostridiales bacterium]